MVAAGYMDCLCRTIFMEVVNVNVYVKQLLHIWDTAKCDPFKVTIIIPMFLNPFVVVVVHPFFQLSPGFLGIASKVGIGPQGKATEETLLIGIGSMRALVNDQGDDVGIGHQVLGEDHLTSPQWEIHLGHNPVDIGDHD